jgi:hypothetical protein
MHNMVQHDGMAVQMPKSLPPWLNQVITAAAAAAAVE